MRAPEFWSRQDATARLTANALSPLGWVYGQVTQWKRLHVEPFHAHAKVVCVGNLTAGGSGKTPIAIAIKTMLDTHRLRAVLLSRGYGGRLSEPTAVDLQKHTAADVGDEALLLAAQGNAVVARDRRAGAALADSLGADVIILDDGHQNFTLQKDVAIVVVDAATGFGNGHVLPAGPLRERVSDGLARADAVVLVGEGAPQLPGYSGPVFRARLVPDGGRELAGKRVMAFAGIGRPEKFFETLEALGAQVIARTSFADHHMFSAKEIVELKSKAQNQNALLITTEKDFARLPKGERENILTLPVRAGFEDPQAFDKFLATALSILPA